MRIKMEEKAQDRSVWKSGFVGACGLILASPKTQRLETDIDDD